MIKKFDVVIGNPPYQGEATGTATHNMPIYWKFMEAAYEVGTKAVLITPARFLFNAGYTPKTWNDDMLSDKHLTVTHYAPNSSEIFPGTDIKGGIVVTYRDEDRFGEPIGTFTKYPELNTIRVKAISSGDGPLTNLGITSGRSYRYTSKMHEDHPEASAILSAGHQYVIGPHNFDRLHFVYHLDRPDGGLAYSQVLGLDGRKRATRWIRSDYITGPDSFGAYKVAIPAANGSGDLGEVLSTPLVLEPNTAVTQTFITIGSFGDRAVADACLAYVKTKFVRALLGVLKITQHNPAKVWAYVPLQDFTRVSDIDWSKPIPDIDQQLYAKYQLDADEIRFIETHIKPMI